MEMEIPVSLWFRAISTRRSRRRFNNLPVAPDLLAHLEAVCTKFKPFTHAKAVLVTESHRRLFKCVVGPYGKIKGAPAFITFVGDMDSPHVPEKVGYTGEGIILEAESSGLATCWVGGFFRKEVAASLIEMN